MKTYFESLDKQKYGTWDNTDSDAYKIFAEMIMPSKSCFIAASFKKMAYYSEYRLHEETAMAKIRKRLDEVGIALFWNGLHKMKTNLMPRRFM